MSSNKKVSAINWDLVGTGDSMLLEISDKIWEIYSEMTESLVDEVSGCFDMLMEQTKKQDIMVELQYIADSYKVNS